MYAREKDTCREPNEEDHVHNKESTNFSKDHLTIIKERTSVLHTGSNAVGPVSTVRTRLYYKEALNVLHSIFLAPYFSEGCWIRETNIPYLLYHDTVDSHLFGTSEEIE